MKGLKETTAHDMPNSQVKKAKIIDFGGFILSSKSSIKIIKQMLIKIYVKTSV